MARSTSKTKIPIEASSLTPSLQLQTSNTKSNNIHSVPIKAKRRLFMCAESPDIEDYGNLFTNKKKKNNNNKKGKAVADTLLDRFRSKRGLFVTDVTRTEWCEMQMEFSLFSEEECKNNDESKKRSGGDDECCGSVVGGRRRRNNEAMKAGIDRHAQLHQEILEPVEVELESCEDYMALKLVNFINGVNQLLFEGLTRELPLVSFAFREGIWMVGKIDEVRLRNNHKNPTLVEIKTRGSDTVPLEPQKRNGRIQLMCYKYLWDNLVVDFPCREFYDYFELNPKRALCKDLKNACANYSAFTLEDVVRCYRNTCKMLPRANACLVLRYESQKDKSVLDEDKFAYDGVWLKKQIGNCLEFWLGQREASSVAEEEQWKCGYCDFVSECPAAADDEESTQEEFSSDDDSSCYYYYY